MKNKKINDILNKYNFEAAVAMILKILAAEIEIIKNKLNIDNQ